MSLHSFDLHKAHAHRGTSKPLTRHDTEKLEVVGTPGTDAGGGRGGVGAEGLGQIS